MLKKTIPVIAALSLAQGLEIYSAPEAPVETTEVQVESKKHHHKKHKKHHKHKHHKESIPACTSFECKKGSATDGYDVPSEPKSNQGQYQFVQKDSVPACTSVECKKGKIIDEWDVPTMPESNHGKYTYANAQRESIPACTSFECKKGKIIDEWDVPTMPESNHGKYTYANAQRESIPACTSFECKKGKIIDEWDVPTMPESNHGKYTYANAQRESIPACTSFECKKGKIIDEWDVPTMPESNHGKYTYANAQRESIPACTSFECKKGKVIDEWDVPTMPESNHGKYTYANAQRESIPACTSFECKKGKIIDEWDVPTMPESNHGKYTYANAQKDSVPACTSLGCKTESIVRGGKEEWPKDYKVPNFGVDNDIKSSLKNMDDAEKKHGPWVLPTEEEAKKNPLFPTNNTLAAGKKVLVQGPAKPVPAQQATVKKSDPICPSSGCPEPKKSNTNPPYPINYKVPDFGMDHDIKDSLKNLDDADKKLGPWVLPPKNETVKVLGPSNNTLAAAKKIATPPQKTALAVNADLNLKDDPICSSAGCTQYKHPKFETYPMDYPVPDFGVDHDVKHTQDHIAQVEKTLGVTWNPDQDDDGKWIVPTEEADFKLTGTTADVHLESDPMCLSTGCETRHSNPYTDAELKASAEVLYAPLDNPLDHDIQTSLDNLSNTETSLGKKMDMSELQLDSQIKTAVKSHTKSANKAVAKQQTSEFAKLRESMMSNWGLKN